MLCPVNIDIITCYIIVLLYKHLFVYILEIVVAKVFVSYRG